MTWTHNSSYSANATIHHGRTDTTINHHQVVLHYNNYNHLTQTCIPSSGANTLLTTKTIMEKNAPVPLTDQKPQYLRVLSLTITGAALTHASPQTNTL